jgi:peptidoglycan-N-acetylglucosamine deacetylase
MKFYRPWPFMRCFYPGAVFRIGTRKKVLYLTFDDGPNPGSTEKLIEILDNSGIKGIFFCNGEAAEKFPELVKGLKANGHIIGNHGYYHLNGWSTSAKTYSDNVKKASEFIESRLFRPPYGRIKFCQFNRIKQEYLVFFWDIMSYDFDLFSDKEKDLTIIIKKARPGSVIVFHDTPGALSTRLLDKFIREAKNAGYSFELPVLNP